MAALSDRPIEGLKGVGPRRREILAGFGIQTVSDLLALVPNSWEDRRSITRLADLAPGAAQTVELELRSPRLIRTRSRMRLVRAEGHQEGHSLGIVWFNRPYLVSQLEGEPRSWILHGTVRERAGGLELVNPSLTPAGGASRRIEPLYRSLGELPAGVVKQLVRTALDTLIDCELEDPLPPQLRQRYSLPDRRQAYLDLHCPEPDADVEALLRGESPAHQRLVYGELLALRLAVEESRRHRSLVRKGRSYSLSPERREEFLAGLPFVPTPGQRRVSHEIFDDLARAAPMHRLLQGDVGSGKTAVALLALQAALVSGFQAVFVAPTELLAEQHFETLRCDLPGDLRIGLFTGSSGGSYRNLSDGTCDLAVGTHALLGKSVCFARLGVAVIDEQQRFGVEQRRSLLARSPETVPDLLVMTATPIPRSLALTLHGDLDLSVLDDLPPGRSLVETTVLPATRREAVYRALRRRISTGERAFVVLPFIEPADEIEVASLAAEGLQIREWLGEENCAVLHGRLTTGERQRAMESFAAGRCRVLLATSIIEVGVDVPQASLMVIESAERFGLAQLHQLRGRIGRGATPGRCAALHGPELTEAGEERLRAFAATNDGFLIAEEDLRIRGEGDLLGLRQAGRPAFASARLGRDRVWLERAARDARELLANGPAQLRPGVHSRAEANGEP